MNKFKTGDTVVAVETIAAIKKGDRYIVDSVLNSEDGYVSVIGDRVWYAQKWFEKVDSEFCMKTQPWFIRANNEEEWKVAVDFVKSKGFSFQYDEHYETGLVITNRCEDVKILYEGVDKMIRSKYTKGKKEIKLSYKTVLDKVEYPEVKSAQQLEIEHIEAEMRKLADRLNKIKGE